MFHKKFVSLFLCILLTFPVFAQTVAKTKNSTTDVSPEVREKALRLLNGLAREAEQFSLPFNRVTARIITANLLWDKDEKTARIVFQSAISDLNGMLGQIPPESAEPDDNYNVER